MESGKGVWVIVLLSALAMVVLYSLDLRNDYYYHWTREEATATVQELKKVPGYKPYLLTFSYFNENLDRRYQCSLKLDWRTGEKIASYSSSSIAITYTRKEACDVYLQEYKHPTIGSLIFHASIFLFIVGGTILIARNVFSN